MLKQLNLKNILFILGIITSNIFSMESLINSLSLMDVYFIDNDSIDEEPKLNKIIINNNVQDQNKVIQDQYNKIIINNNVQDNNKPIEDQYNKINLMDVYFIDKDSIDEEPKLNKIIISNNVQDNNKVIQDQYNKIIIEEVNDEFNIKEF